MDKTSKTAGRPNTKVAKWLAEIASAEKRLKDFRKSARQITKLYEGEKASESPFNILYSNTETLAPALYNNLPRAVVQRRFKDDDPLGKVASDVAKRTLEFLLDNEVGDYTPFDDLMLQAVLEALVPGQGITRFKYDATIKEKAEESEESEESEEDSVTYETVCGESVPWDRFLHGYAKQWKDVPWVAFEHFMTREELVKNFGDTIGNLVPLTVSGKECGGGDEDESGSYKLADAEGVTLAHVFEIWDKESKTVKFVAPSYAENFLRDVEDPLQLTGFFPLARPLTLFPKISSLVPVPLYTMYEEQAKELNRVTTRINKIIQALKVRGFYDSTIEGLEKVLEAEDNTLIPAVNVVALQQGQTLEKSIWLMPLEKLIAVLQQLYVQRQQIKQVIYEITGISDILRGASVASETATAQNIKNQWGTLRLKKAQKLVSRYVRDCLRIMAEIALTKFSRETLAGMTGLEFPTAAQKQQAQAVLAQVQQAQAMQPPGQPPAPPPPPQILTMAQLPSWEEILTLLADDLQRNYRIDIETNSTVDAEATEDKENMGEFLNAVAQFMNGVAPLVQTGVMPFDAAKSILLAVTRRYRFGPEVEDELKKMQAPQPPGGEGGEGAKAAEAKAKLELQTAETEAKVRMELLEIDKQVKHAELQAKLRELQRKEELAVTTHALKLREARRKAAEPAPEPKSAGNTQQ